MVLHIYCTKILDKYSIKKFELYAIYFRCVPVPLRIPFSVDFWGNYDLNGGTQRRVLPFSPS